MSLDTFMADNQNSINAGSNFLSAFMSYNADKAMYKAKKAWQTYSNTMVRLSDAVSQNAITQNELMSQTALANQAIDMKRGNILTQARAEVSAAAAGVKGRSVNQVMVDINRNAAMQERQRQISWENANLAFDQQRLGSSMQAAMQQDYTYLPKPKLGQYLLQAGMNAAQSMAKGG